MSIYEYTTKAGKKRYRVEVLVGYGIDGSADRRTKSCKTKKEALSTHSYFENLKDRLNGRSDKITFREFVERYYLPSKRKCLAKSTMRNYESVIKNHLMPRFENHKLGEIRRFEIQSVISSKKSWEVAKRTHEGLRQILTEAVHLEVIQNNPAIGRYAFPEREERNRKTGPASAGMILNVAHCPTSFLYWPRIRGDDPIDR